MQLCTCVCVWKFKSIKYRAESERGSNASESGLGNSVKSKLRVLSCRFLRTVSECLRQSLRTPALKDDTNNDLAQALV